MQNLDIKNKYEKYLAQKLNEMDRSPDIELEKGNLKNIINDVAYDEVGRRINRKSVGWFNEDYRKAITEKNEARNKCINRDTRTHREGHRKREKKARKICGYNKREMINNEIKYL